MWGRAIVENDSFSFFLPTRPCKFTYKLNDKTYQATSTIHGGNKTFTTGWRHVVGASYPSEEDEKLLITAFGGEQQAVCKNQQGEVITKRLDELKLLDQYSVLIAGPPAPDVRGGERAKQPGKLLHRGIYMSEDPQDVLEKLKKQGNVNFHIAAMRDVPDGERGSTTNWSETDIKAIFQKQENRKCGMHAINHALLEKGEAPHTTAVLDGHQNDARGFDMAQFDDVPDPMEIFDTNDGNDIPHLQMVRTLRSLCSQKQIPILGELDSCHFEWKCTSETLKKSLFVVFMLGDGNNGHWVCIRQMKVNDQDVFLLFDSLGLR